MTRSLIIDVGTSNAKVGVVNASGEVVASGSREIPAHRPERGAFEHDPDELLDVVGELSREAVPSDRATISAVVLSGYQFGFLPLDAAGRPLMGMMTLLDGRPKSVMERIQSEWPVQEIYRRTGCPPLFTYVLPKLVWLKSEKPEMFDRAARFAGLKSFLLEKLTGQFVTEPSIASATQLLNIHESDWDDEILEWVGIRRESLPKVVPGEDVVGGLSSAGAQRLGLEADTPVLPGLYDGGAMLVGMGAYDGDVTVCNLGTTAMVRGCAEAPLLDDPAKMRLQTYALTADRWAIGGAINNAGIALRWFRDALAPGDSYEVLSNRAEQVAAGADGLFCLPFLTGERDPRIGNLASGGFFGIKEYHGKGHVSRSIMEGVAYALRMIRDAIAENGFQADRLRIAGSGAESDLWMDVVANVLETPVERAETPDATLIGSSMLAFRALGHYDDLREAADEMVRLGRQTVPDPELVQTYEQTYAFFRRLVDALRPLYGTHAERFL